MFWYHTTLLSLFSHKNKQKRHIDVLEWKVIQKLRKVLITIKAWAESEKAVKTFDEYTAEKVKTSFDLSEWFYLRNIKE